MKPARLFFAPLWLAQLATGAKSFRDNPLIGSPALNRYGLHAARMRLAHMLAWHRRARLAPLVAAEDRDAFDRDGFVVKPAFLPEDDFSRLRDGVLGYRGAAREMLQGDTITRRIAVDPAALRAVPELAALLARSDWRGLTRYAGSFDQEPLTYIQTILSQVRQARPDPQTALHADTFHPTVKAWLFLTDVAEDEGPFVYVPGSHRLTPARLAWEKATSLTAAASDNRLLARGSFRATGEEIAAMGYGAPRAFAVPANTLVVADTVGFHARGLSLRPSKRVEIWAFGRRNPFLPWAGFDPGSLPGIAERRIGWMWQARDLAERLGLGGNAWRDVGPLRPQDPPGLPVR